MILCDVGVLLAAMMEHSPHHQACFAPVERLRMRGSPHAVSELILAAVVRIATNPKVFKPPAKAAEGFAFVDLLRADPSAITVAPGARHWGIFRGLVEDHGLRGPDTTDAYLAALAIEHGCEWWTIDRGFSRFPKLRWRNLLDAPPDAPR